MTHACTGRGVHTTSDIKKEEITALEQELSEYHTRHADQFGPLDLCQETKCLETKAAIQWLKAQSQSRVGHAVSE